MSTYARCFNDGSNGITKCGICSSSVNNSSDLSNTSVCPVTWQIGTWGNTSVILPDDLFSDGGNSDVSCAAANLCAALPSIEKLIAVAIAFVVTFYGVFIALKLIRKLTDAY